MGWMPPGYLILPLSNSTDKGQVRMGSVEWKSIMYKAGYKLFHIYTISHIHRYIGSQEEWAPALISCIKKHQCPGLDTHCCYTRRGVQGLIVTD